MNSIAKEQEIKKITRIGATRLGNDYQDIVALDLIVNFLEHPKSFEWIKVEAYNEAKYLDDVYAKLENGKIVARQVKYATHPDEIWDWDDLLKQTENSTSLLQKWVESWQRISAQQRVEEMVLWTNRDTGPNIKLALNYDGKIDPAKVEKDTWNKIIDQVTVKVDIKEFFNLFRFKFKEQELDSLKQSVTRRLEKLGVSFEGRVSLSETVRNWVIYKDKPSRDGKIRLKDIKVAALWYDLKQIPQNFEIPSDYVLPSTDFHKNIIERIESKTENIIVINAPPALGKSTYLSFLVQELKSKEVPVVRHHYFLSLRDKTPERFEHRKILESLMKEIQSNYYDAVENETRNPSPTLFQEWLNKCSDYYSNINKPFVVIIDGLDHVYRENESVVELNKLFDQLLPVENGIIIIIGTQPVEDKNLPFKLLQIKPRNTWIDLPLFSRNAIEKWLIIHSEDISLNLDDLTVNSRLPSLVNAFYEISMGHPLVLKVSLKELLIKNDFVSEYHIRNLIQNINSSDIRDYYNKLWLRINSNSKYILILITCCPYEWSKENLLDTLSTSTAERALIDDAFESIRHLLINDSLGWRLFHKSIYLFIENTQEFLVNKTDINKKALVWIKEGHSKYLKWAYEARLEAEIGNINPLINRTSRNWLIDSMVDFYPHEEILITLQKCGEFSLRSFNFQRFVANGLVADYYHQAVGYQNDGLKKLFLPRAFVNKEEIVINKFTEKIDELTDEELIDYARLQKYFGNEDILYKIFECANERIKYAEIPSDREIPITTTTRVAALADKVETDRIFRYISSSREKNNNLKILKYFCSECLHSKLKTRIFNLFEKGSELIQNEIDMMGGCLALLSIEDRTDVVSFFNSIKIKNSIWIIYLYLNNKLNTTTEIEFPSMKILNRPEYELYQYRELIEETFYEVFFVFLANKLQNENKKNEDFIVDQGEHTWARKFIKKLYEFSEVVFIKLNNKELIQYSEIFDYLNTLKKPDFDEERDDFEFGKGAGKALISVANVLFRISKFTIPNIEINKDELVNAFSSEYVFTREWIEKYLVQNRKLLSAEGYQYLFNKVSEMLNSTIEMFYERAIDYALLARISVLHNDKINCLEFIRKSIENTISYGGHKDLYFSGCLEVIENLYKKGIGETNEWLLSIIQPILYINEYTDKDETRHTPKDLIDTLYLIDKKMFLDYYKWLLKIEEYWYAEYAFHLYLRSNDLVNEIQKAVAKTAVDIESLKILNAKKDRGNEEAAKIVTYFESLYGKYKVIEKEDSTISPKYESKIKKEDIIEYDKYPPEMFEKFLGLFNDRIPYELRYPLNNWLNYWSSTDKVIAALNKIEEFIQDDNDFDITYRMFQLTQIYKGDREAYPWLVKSFISNYNWQRYFVSRERVREIFLIIQERYSSKWELFIIDTMIDKYSGKISVGTASKYHHLIEYFIEMNQIELAKKIGFEVINFGLELVSPLKFDKPNWIATRE